MLWLFASVLVLVASLVLVGRAILPLATRALDLAERRVDTLAKRADRSPPPKRDSIPQDLWMTAMSESTEWARQDKLKWFHQVCDELGSWDAVRSSHAQRGN